MNYNEIEIHYYLPEGIHSADAYQIAKAENEFISLIKELGQLLEIDFKLETEALSEGGIRQKWKAFGKNSGQIGCLLAIVGIVIALRPQTDRELIELQKEESRLHIEYLKKQLEEASEEEPSEDEVIEAAKEASSTIKVTRRRSNFFQAIQREEKISAVSFSVLEDGAPIREPTQIDRPEFPDYIALTGELPTELDENAEIGIISPVLTKGRFKWKGEYGGQFIEFWIQDKKFKESVLRKQIEFHNGTAIKCVLEMKIKVDEIGDLSKAGYYVKVVKQVVDEGFEFTTESGRNYLAKKEYEKNQLNLFE